MDDQNAASDLKSENLDWEEINHFTGAELGSFWPCCSSQSHQTLNFVRERSQATPGGLDGALYLIGAYNPSAVKSPGGGEDYFTLYRVNVDVHGNPQSPLLTHVKRLHVTTKSLAGDTSHFAGSRACTSIPPASSSSTPTSTTSRGRSALIPSPGRTGGRSGAASGATGRWCVPAARP